MYALAIKNATGKQISGTFYLPIKNVVEKADNEENIYKLIGFYTDNNDLPVAYDKNITSTLKSEYVNMTLKKDGTLSKRSDKVLSPNQMEKLMQYSKDISTNAIHDICCGTFKASPLKSDAMHNACTYCPYLVLCSKASNNVSFRETSKVNIDSFLGGEDE